MYIILAILALGILIFVHECGHYLAARLSGIWVERFSLGFGPVLLSAKRGGTEYALSLVPLGGYVNLHRMTEEIEAVKGKEGEAFFNKPYRIKIFVITAGVLFNMLFAMLLLMAVYMVGYKTYAPVVSSVEESAASYGFLPQDRILNVNGQRVRSWDEFLTLLAPEAPYPARVDVDRGGAPLTLSFTPTFRESVDPLGDKIYIPETGLHVYMPPLTGSVTAGSPAAKAGLKPGDRFISIEGTPIYEWGDISKYIRQSEGTISVTIERGGAEKTLDITPKLGGADGKTPIIGIAASDGDTLLREYPLKAAYLGVSQTVTLTKLVFVGIGKLITGKIKRDNIGGPILIVSEGRNSAKAGLSTYLLYIAFISVNLAVLNILPIPILDGGHVLIYTIEKITSRKLAARVRESSQMVGMALLGLLMIYAVYNDILRFFK